MPTTWSARTEYFDDEFGGWRWDASAGFDACVRRRSGRRRSIRRTSHSVDGRPVRDHAHGRPRGDVRPALHLLVHRAQHVVGAVSSQLRAHAELHGRRRTPSRSRRAVGTTTSASCRRRGAASCACTARAARARRSRANASGTSTVRDGAADVHAARARLQPAVVPLEPRAALGMAAGQHGVSHLAAEPPGRERGGPADRRPRDLWDSTRATGDNFFVVKVSYWMGIR